MTDRSRLDSVSSVGDADIRTKTWTRFEYDRLVEAEILGREDRIELLAGAMVIALDDESEPEPDICVVPGDPRDYRGAHPERPALIVEVALSRLRFDREHKGSLYARAWIADYWIVNIPDRRLAVYRDPAPDAAAPFAWRYGRVATLGPDERVAPLAVPAASVSVADLLP